MSQGTGITVRLKGMISDYGAVDGLLLALQRAVRLLFPAAVIERQYIVAQPVPPTPAPLLRRGRDIEVRRIQPGDPALTGFTRVPAEVAERFAQGAVCLGAFRGSELLGWLWFTIGSFRDYTHPVDFALQPAATTAWDFDVYVRPEARLTAAFARLWEAAFDALRERGVSRTLSAISAYNPASLRAHRRLGTRAFGSVLMVRFGRLSAFCSRRFQPHLQASLRPGFRATFRLDAPAVPAE